MDSVKTALRIFEAVAERGEAALADLVPVIAAPKSTVQRGLVTLHEAGWLRPVEDGGRRRWSVSTRLLTLLRPQDDLLALRRAALPVLERLRDETRETIHLTVRDGDRIVLIERCDSPQVLRAGWPLGAMAPLHIGSSGKAVLATLSEPALERYVARDLEAWTEHSLVDRARLRSELAHIRERGFSVSDRELDVSVRSVAAPILDANGQALAAISISCPVSRLPDDLIPTLGARVRVAAEEVARLGRS